MSGGQQVGKEEFEIAPNGADWVARGTAEVKTSDGTSRVSGTLEMRNDGHSSALRLVHAGNEESGGGHQF